MKARSNHFGFSAVEAVLILVIVGLVGLVGYKVYNTKSSADKTANETTAGSGQLLTSSGSAIPSSIKSSTDIEQAEKALDQYDSSSSDSSDLSQLDSELAAF